VGKVRGVQARFDPPPYAICYTKCGGFGSAYLTEKECILPAFCAMALVYSVLARCKTGDRDLAWIIGWVRERVDLRIESILLGGVGRSNMVGELRCAFPVVRGRMESS
jgi:hypothetical protein